MYLEGSSWQERYLANEVFTLRCKIADKPGMLGKVSQAIGNCNVHVGTIDLVELDAQNQIRDFLIHCSSDAEMEKVVESVKALDDVEIIEVFDEVMEIHRRGTIEMVSRAPIETLTDLRMVYTPGVAKTCEKIKEDPETAWEMTGICDRVAIVTNGTAVLGLGAIGPLASLPVMEGKAAIFAEFAGISAVPVLVDSNDVDTIVETVMLTHGSYGAIQLEDIGAPACFEIEDKLRARLDKPVFHDDQHGTATIVLAALINALKMTNRKPEDSTVLMLGAGSAGIAISKILLDFGIKDIVIYDSTGPIYRGRTERMNPYKEQIAEITNKDNITCPLAEGFAGKDIFIGVAQPNMVSKDMIASMADDPISFPLSNPVGEISKEESLEAGAAVVADGRDCNNALAYPGLFRGALDAHAKSITPAMQVAAATKLAEIAPEGDLLPDMLDRDVHRQVAEAVAQQYKSTL